MEEQRSSQTVLILRDELILEAEAGGEHAVESEAGVLLLSNELLPEPVIKKIDVGPRVSSLDPPDDKGERELRAELVGARWSAKAWQPDARPAAPHENLVRVSTPSEPIAARETEQPERQATEPTELARILFEARAFASEYGAMKARTRKALYEALGRTYDFAIRAEEQPEQCARLIKDAGLTIQHRASYSPIVRLVFGADYDKTRVTEFVAAISYGRRKNLPSGEFFAFLDQFEGGLKAVIGLERLMRKGDFDACDTATRDQARPAMARKLREIRLSAWNDLAIEGDEFALVLARRIPEGGVAVVGEVPRDIALLERAARKLLAEQVRAGEGQRQPVKYHPEEV